MARLVHTEQAPIHRRESKCGRKRTRTSKGLLPHAPQACAYTNSAIRPHCISSTCPAIVLARRSHPPTKRLSQAKSRLSPCPIYAPYSPFSPFISSASFTSPEAASSIFSAAASSFLSSGFKKSLSAAYFKRKDLRDLSRIK